MLNAYILTVTIIATLGTTATPTMTRSVSYFHDLEACEAAKAKELAGDFVRAPNTSSSKIPAVYSAIKAECDAKATVE